MSAKCLVLQSEEKGSMLFWECPQEKCSHSIQLHSPEAALKSIYMNGASSYYSYRIRTPLCPQICADLGSILHSLFLSSWLPNAMLDPEWVQNWTIKSRNNTALVVKYCLNFCQCTFCRYDVFLLCSTCNSSVTLQS